MAPGKGAHLILNEKYLEFVLDALHQVENQYSDNLHDTEPEAVIKNLVEGGWTRVKDKFGTKAYKSAQYKEGELRVTVVLNNQGDLRLDIREWFEPS